MSQSVLATRTTAEDVDVGLVGDERKALSVALSNVLADTYLLLVKTHVYHWNVVGPIFLPIHELTEQHYNDLFAAADEIAERIRALGQPAPLAFRELSVQAAVKEESMQKTAEEMVQQLVHDHEEIARRLRSITADAANLEDFVTHDMLNARLAFHEKAIWMLRAIIS